MPRQAKLTGGRALLERLERQPIVAATISPVEVAAAAATPTEVVMLNSADLASLSGMVEDARSAGLLCMVHTEMVPGLANDAAAVSYLRAIGVQGIMSTRAATVAAAQNAGLIAVQRIFCTDRRAVERSLTTIEHVRPDLVEVSPAVALGALDAGTRKRFSPMLACGLVTEPAEVNWLLDLGALGVTTSAPGLWTYAFRPSSRG
jgi:glycerol uptake operon antiterminator